MPMLNIRTSWPVDELFDQAIASVTDDTRWLVQTQSAQSLVLRREKSLPIWKLILVGFVALLTFGLGLLLLLILIPDLKNQQIVITARPANGSVVGRITYTSGAAKRVNTLVQSMPRLRKRLKET